LPRGGKAHIEALGRDVNAARMWSDLMKTVLLVSALAAVALGGCTRIVDHQGYILDQQLVKAVQPGVDNKQSVKKTLGKPSFTSEWNDDIWYYVARNTSQLAFLQPEPTAQEVLVVRFDDAGNVSKVDHDTSLAQIVEIDPVNDKTPVFGRDTGLFEDIFGNIGTVGTSGAPGPGPN
jgi:outer membrane protein assembly factor BamE (lipoprotein component of BamABCDE complex)